MLFAVKTHLDGSTHEQSICGQLFAGHEVGSRPMERKGKMHWMTITKSYMFYLDTQASEINNRAVSKA